MSYDIKDILDFNFSIDNLQRLAIRLSEDIVFQNIKKRIHRINSLTKSNIERIITKPDNESLSNCFNKFKRHLQLNDISSDQFSKKELKNLAYGLNYSEGNYSAIFNNEFDLTTLLFILEEKWRDSYLLGLLDCYLKNWKDSNNIESFDLLSKHLSSRINNYSGNRKFISAIHQNQRYFSPSNGDVILGADMALSKRPILEVLSYLSLPESWITYNYFSKVIDTYYEKRKSHLIDILYEMEIIFIIHGNNATTKRTFSKIIIQANAEGNDVIISKVKDMAFRLIGDPETQINWYPFEGATDIEISRLINARSIVNDWIKKQFISVFFEKCINDKRRKKFWLKLIKEINQFRVVGSNSTKRMLKNDERISNLIDARFIETMSSSPNSAILLTIKDRIMVEFSDNGASYVYKSSNNKAPKLELKRISSVEKLKYTNLPMLFYRNGYYVYSKQPEGRQIHRDGDLSWESAFENWFKSELNINV